MFLIFFLVSIFLTAASARAADDLIPLKLIQALPIEGPENSQPSGLTLSGDTLFAVSDKHDNTVFRIELHSDHAALLPHSTFQIAPPDTSVERLDFEGITRDAAGNFYIVSETAFRILKFNADAGQPQWITPDLRPHGEKAGLFQTHNANLEGIALLDQGIFLLCAERQPRGLIEIDLNAAPPAIRAFDYNHTRLEYPTHRNPDFSGMYSDGKDLYVVERSADAICKVEYGGKELVQKETWSYRHIINDPEVGYSYNKYGLGEGLCMDEERVYIVETVRL